MGVSGYFLTDENNEVLSVSVDGAGDLAKSHVKTYTRKDGSVVKEHDDKRQAAVAPVRAYPAHVKNKADEISHLGSDKAREDLTPDEKARLKKIQSQAGLGKNSPEYLAHAKASDDAYVPNESAIAQRMKEGMQESDARAVDTHHHRIAWAKRTAAAAAAPSVPDGDAPAGDAAASGGDAAAGAAPSGGDAGSSDAASGGDAGAAEDDHPAVVGKATDLQGGNAEKCDSFKFSGDEFVATGKDGKSNHDQTPVREFESEGGERVWLDGAGRVHADNEGEVQSRRDHAKGYEAGSSSAAATDAPAAKPARTRKPKAAAAKPAWKGSDGLGLEDDEDEVATQKLEDEGMTRSDAQGVHEANKLMKERGEKPSGDRSDPPAKEAPVAKTANEGFGYHGEAFYDHFRESHGGNADASPFEAPESEYNASMAAGHKKFGEAAQKLVDGGHFGSHDEARDYLDSTHGRHLHDGGTFHGGDIAKVPWLAKDVAHYKKKLAQRGGGEEPVRKSMLLIRR